MDCVLAATLFRNFLFTVRPFLLRIFPILVEHGHLTLGSRSKSFACIFLGPNFGNLKRISKILFSIYSSIIFGFEGGVLLLSQRPAIPSSSNRYNHLYPVGLLIPNSLHASEKFEPSIT